MLLTSTTNMEQRNINSEMDCVNILQTTRDSQALLNLVLEEHQKLLLLYNDAKVSFILFKILGFKRFRI